jgi:hypothetical protein
MSETDIQTGATLMYSFMSSLAADVMHCAMPNWYSTMASLVATVIDVVCHF